MQKFATALYGRTSKDDRRRLTIENQQKALREWASRDEHVACVVDEYWDEGISGKTPLWERPQGRRLMEDAKAGRIRSVAVVFADRFGRTVLDALQAARDLAHLGVKLVAVGDRWDERRNDSPLNIQMRLMVAEEEHRRIAERTLSGKLRAMERDKAPPGGPLVFGYRMDDHGRFVEHPEEALIVRRIFQMALEGHTNSEILAWAQTTGVAAGRKWQKRALGSVPTPDVNHGSAQWHLTKIAKILRNRVYVGERSWGERVFECLALVDRKTFERVQVLNQRRSEVRGPYRKPERGLLSGLLVCETCGARFYHRFNQSPSRDGTVHRHSIYVCNTARKHWDQCKSKTLRVDYLDPDVWAVIESFLEDPEAVVRKVIADEQTTGQSDELHSQELALVEELEGIEKEVNQVWAMQRDHGLPLEFVATKLNELKVRRERVQKAVDGVRRERAAALHDAEQAVAVADAVASIRDKLKNGLTAQEKQEIVRLMVADGTVTTVGEGPQKEARIQLGIRWVPQPEAEKAAPYPQVPEH